VDALFKQDESILQVLQYGELSLKGEFIWGSNTTFFLLSCYQDKNFKVVYKPVKGERPLWDFPPASLAKREVAAFTLSELLGWRLVPPTIFRQDAPFGPGSIQLYIDHDPEYHYFNFSLKDRQRLRRVVVFDLLANNADRKGSHLLVDSDDHLWLIDHGICFHEEIKLRTVIWDFAGEPIPDDLLENINHLLEYLHLSREEYSNKSSLLVDLLNGPEIQALIRRAEWIMQAKIFPDPPPDRRPYPWPLV